MGDVTLEVSGLVSGYGRMPVLHGVDMTIQGDDKPGLIGPNGHGKTTFFRTISGLNRAWEGTVRFMGEDITNRPAAQIMRLGLVHAPQGNTLFREMSVEENLLLGGFAPRARAVHKTTLEQVFELFPRLAERRRQSARTLSGGERQMVAISCGLMALPKLLVLDEPTLGLSPKLKMELRDAIAKIVESGVQTMIVEQDPEFLSTLTTRLFFMSEGRIEADIGDGKSLEYCRIREMYFGVA
ncbi:MAG: ABC transporter ATP-binding protein [Rhizobiaceae bacterium MnEN-MB40S]|nr:MAG: ABC transporter ATP-binding protein [Rhizobiaceae bacterium MnEN-MB40S]